MGTITLLDFYNHITAYADLYKIDKFDHQFIFDYAYGGMTDQYAIPDNYMDIIIFVRNVANIDMRGDALSAVLKDISLPALHL